MKLTRRALLKSSVILAGCGTAVLGPQNNPVNTGATGPTGGVPGPDPTGETPAVIDQPKPKPGEPPTAVVAPLEVTESLDAFPLAVMSGELMPDAATVWTRYAGSRSLALYVWVDPKLATTSPAPTDDLGFVHFDVSELEPLTRYSYAFVELEGSQPISRSPVGKFKTAPRSDYYGTVTFGAASCTHQRRMPFPVMAKAGETPLDFFVHGGDHCYTDGAESENDYIDIYAETWAASGMRALHSNHGLFTAWDDHEFENNFNPETISAERLAWATDTFFRHHPVKRIASAPNKLWRSFKFGMSVELFILDSRSERKPSTRNTASAEYISVAQMNWLKDGLKNSSAKYKFIVNSVPIGKFGGLFALAANDRWEGYAAQRTELLDHIVDEEIENVWFISGDFHLGAVSKVESSGKYSGIREVLAGPGGNWENPFWSTLQGTASLDFLTPETNFVIFSVDPLLAKLKVTFVDKDGKALFDKTYDAD